MLFRSTKETLLASIPTIPVGVIFPFAGTVVPHGYLLCDGSEVKISDYAELYNIIGYSYKPATSLRGLTTFALPDLRGRFALGKDNMNNGITVPSKSNSNIFISTGGGSANRVTDITADSVGMSGGLEQRTLTITNLPDHKHTMSSPDAQYYAAGVPGAPSDPYAVSGLGLPNTSTGSGLPNSGGVESTTLGAPFNVMNPYQTINYIIYTGVF